MGWHDKIWNVLFLLNWLEVHDFPIEGKLVNLIEWNRILTQLGQREQILQAKFFNDYELQMLV